MNNRIAPATKLKRGTEHFLNGKPVYIERDKGDGTVFITDSKERLPGDNYWWVNKVDLQSQPKYNTTLKIVKVKPAKKKEKDEYSDFYKSIAPTVANNCQNCRQDLFAFTNWQRKCVSAHILPKEFFKSIATDPKNILFMGVQIKGTQCRCRCHTLWDETVENRLSNKFEHARNLAIKRYNEYLKPKLTPKEISRAEEYLGIRAKSQNLAKDIEKGEVKV